MVETATEIRVALENSPGTLGEAATSLGEAGINILGFSLDADGASGTARFVTDDPEQATAELETLGLSPTSEEILLASAPNEPGQLGRLGAALGDSGVNIETAFPVVDPTTEETNIAFEVDDPSSARKVLQG